MYVNYYDSIKREDNNTIFSSEYKLNLQTERELINMVEEEKKNIELYK